MAYFGKDDPKPGKAWYAVQKTKAVFKNAKSLIREFTVATVRTGATAVLGAVIINPITAIAGLSITGMLSLPITVPLAIGAGVFAWAKRDGIAQWNKEAWADIVDNKVVKGDVSAAEGKWLEKKQAPGFFQKLKAKLTFSKKTTEEAEIEAPEIDEVADEVTETVTASAPQESKFKPKRKDASESFENVANNNEEETPAEEVPTASAPRKKWQPKARNKA